MKRRIAPIAAALSLLFVMSAQAADLSPADEKKRTQLFNDGKSLFDAGKWSEAAAKFRAVVELRSAPKALIALGLAEEKGGRLVEAKQHFEQARDDARAAGLKAEEDSASSSLRQLLPRIPRIAVKVPEDIKGAEASIDGKKLEPGSFDIDVDPGEHAVTVTAEGYQPFEEKVTLAERDRRDVSVVLAPIGDTSNPPPAPPSTGFRVPPVGAIVLAGLGIGAGSAGAVLLFLGRAKESEIQLACGGTTCPASFEADASAAATKIIVGDVLIGVGAAAVIGGSIWWIVSGPPAEAPASSSAARPRVLVSPIRSGAWVGVDGRF